MNILFLTLLDFSTLEDSNIYTDLLKVFLKNGHNLSIISPVERRNNQKTSIIQTPNVQILKLRIGNVQKTNFIEKGISTLTLEHKFINGIKKYFSKTKFDLVLYSTPPITFEKAIRYVKNRDEAMTYLMLKDIFPQNAIDIGLLSKSGIKGRLYHHFKKKEERLYDVSDIIGCMSKANVEYIKKHSKSAQTKQIEVCPNSIEPSNLVYTQEQKQKVRSKYGLPTDKTIFVYGGNLGKPQGVDFIIECLRKNEENENSFILIAGSGTEQNKLEEYFIGHKPKNSKLIPFLPKIDYDLLIRCCDVGLIFLDHRFTIPNYPSRILSYMDAALPILAATDTNTDIKQLIIEEKLGYWCESNDVNSFFNSLQLLCKRDVLLRMGNNSKKTLISRFTSNLAFEIISKHLSDK